METTKGSATAACDSVDAVAWLEEFDSAFARIGGRFARVEPRRQARAYLLGLLADVETRSCWQLAEHAGDQSPHRMQRLLGEAVWDADAVRDDVRGYVADELGDPNGVLIIDDTGDLKKGSHSVGVQRQYTGTAEENAQVGVFLGYAAGGGYTLIDREVYLPRSWTDDPERCAGAAVPDRVRFATKISLARRMLTRALAAGVPAAWATPDEAHAILTVIATHERAHHPPEQQKLVPLSVNEIRRLLAKLVINAAHSIDHWLGWSRWRRRHQARARTSHHRRRGQLEHRPGPT